MNVFPPRGSPQEWYVLSLSSSSFYFYAALTPMSFTAWLGCTYTSGICGDLYNSRLERYKDLLNVDD